MISGTKLRKKSQSMSDFGESFYPPSETRERLGVDGYLQELVLVTQIKRYIDTSTNNKKPPGSNLSKTIRSVVNNPQD